MQQGRLVAEAVPWEVGLCGEAGGRVSRGVRRARSQRGAPAWAAALGQGDSLTFQLVTCPGHSGVCGFQVTLGQEQQSLGICKSSVTFPENGI